MNPADGPTAPLPIVGIQTRLAKSSRREALGCSQSIETPAAGSRNPLVQSGLGGDVGAAVPFPHMCPASRDAG